jgi:hypothetical protein
MQIFIALNRLKLQQLKRRPIGWKHVLKQTRSAVRKKQERRPMKRLLLRARRRREMMQMQMQMRLLWLRPSQRHQSEAAPKQKYRQQEQQHRQRHQTTAVVVGGVGVIHPFRMYALDALNLATPNCAPVALWLDIARQSVRRRIGSGTRRSARSWLQHKP